MKRIGHTLLSGQRAVLFLSLMIRFLVGGYDGMFGPGAGTFAIFAFSSIMKYDLKTASGNAKIVNLASNYASLLTFARRNCLLPDRDPCRDITL